MSKPKFNPEITRIKLNPEQAVLTCACYSTGYKAGTFQISWHLVCKLGPKSSGTNTKSWTSGTVKT